MSKKQCQKTDIYIYKYFFDIALTTNEREEPETVKKRVTCRAFL